MFYNVERLIFSVRTTLTMVKEMQSVKEEVILKQKELQRESRLECPSLRLSVCDLSKKRIVERSILQLSSPSGSDMEFVKN